MDVNKETTKEPTITTKQFSKPLLGCEVHFFVLKLQKSFLLWVGTEPSFKTLAVAMNSRLDSQPLSTQLLGDSRNTTSLNLSKQLALKSSCQCFVSMNIADESVRQLAEKYVIELCTNHPDLFSF